MAYVMSMIIHPMWIGSMSHVDCKKGSCRPVEFKGQVPFASGILMSCSNTR